MADKNTETTRLLPSATAEPQPHKSLRKRMWPYLVLVSCYVSYVLAAGFNYGVVGSLTQAQQTKFNVTLSESSWTGSVHIAAFFISGKRQEGNGPVKQ